MSSDLASISRIERLHAATFSTGTLAMLIGIVLGSPHALLLSGVCLILSGLLIFTGSRISMRGPLGDVLRLALGRRRVITIYLRGGFWVLFGLLMVLLAVLAFRDGQPLPLNPRLAA